MPKGAKSNKANNTDKKNDPQKAVRKRSTDKARRAAAYINDSEDPALMSYQTPVLLQKDEDTVAEMEQQDNNSKKNKKTSSSKSSKKSKTSTNGPKILADTYALPKLKFDLDKKLNVGRSKAKNFFINSNKKYKESSSSIKKQILENFPIVLECQRILGRVSKVKKISKKIQSKNNNRRKNEDENDLLDHLLDNDDDTKNQNELTLGLLDIMNDQLEDLLKVVCMLDDKIIRQSDDQALLKKQLAQIELGVKEDLAKLSGRPMFVHRSGTGSANQSDYDTVNSINQNPIIFYPTTELQANLFSQK